MIDDLKNIIAVYHGSTVIINVNRLSKTNKRNTNLI
jgi:hypothetical protein